jgi:hypothetical protein
MPAQVQNKAIVKKIQIYKYLSNSKLNRINSKSKTSRILDLIFFYIVLIGLYIFEKYWMKKTSTSFVSNFYINLNEA